MHWCFQGVSGRTATARRYRGTSRRTTRGASLNGKKNPRKLRKRQETADRPVLGPVSVHRRQPRNSKSRTFGVYGTLNGAGALAVCLIRPFLPLPSFPCILFLAFAVLCVLSVPLRPLRLPAVAVAVAPAVTRVGQPERL